MRKVRAYAGSVIVIGMVIIILAKWLSGNGPTGF